MLEVFACSRVQHCLRFGLHLLNRLKEVLPSVSTSEPGRGHKSYIQQVTVGALSWRKIYKLLRHLAGRLRRTTSRQRYQRHELFSFGLAG